MVTVANTIDGGWDLTSTESLLIALLAGFGALVAWCAWIWRRQGHRRHAAGGSAAGVTIVLGSAILVAVGGPQAISSLRRRSGDRELFPRRATGLRRRHAVRGAANADDFIRCRTLTGLSKQEILRVLGRQDGTSATPQTDLGNA